jgi:Transcription factor zinc-finger
MSRHVPFDGSHWDPRKLRAIREFGWFRQHEPEMMQDANDRESNALRKKIAAERAAVLASAAIRRCPYCATDMQEKNAGEFSILECPLCRGIFVQEKDIETALESASNRRRFLRFLGGRP